MDKVIIEKLITRKNFMKDHNLKYLEFTALVPNKLDMLREIAESLPEGKRKASMKEIIVWFNDAFTEVLKDYEGLQEGSQLRNTLEDAIGSLIAKENEIQMWTDIIKNRKK
jgi:hypothetical protein